MTNNFEFTVLSDLNMRVWDVEMRQGFIFILMTYYWETRVCREFMRIDSSK